MSAPEFKADASEEDSVAPNDATEAVEVLDEFAVQLALEVEKRMMELKLAGESMKPKKLTASIQHVSQTGVFSVKFSNAMNFDYLKQIFKGVEASANSNAANYSIEELIKANAAIKVEIVDQ